jgi:hypothetical protein
MTMLILTEERKRKETKEKCKLRIIRVREESLEKGSESKRERQKRKEETRKETIKRKKKVFLLTFKRNECKERDLRF